MKHYLSFPSIKNTQRFTSLFATYPRAQISYSVVAETMESCIIKCAISRYPQDKYPGVGHSSCFLDADAKWNIMFEETKNTAFDRACQNILLPSALQERYSRSERFRTDHAAFAWLYEKAKTGEKMTDERRLTYSFLLKKMDINDEKIVNRVQNILAKTIPTTEEMTNMVTFFVENAIAQEEPIDLFSHLMVTDTRLNILPSNDIALIPVFELKQLLAKFYPTSTISTNIITYSKSKIIVEAKIYIQSGGEILRECSNIAIAHRGASPWIVNLAPVESAESFAIRNAIQVLDIETTYPIQTLSDGRNSIEEIKGQANGDAQIKLYMRIQKILERKAATVGLPESNIPTISKWIEARGEALSEVGNREIITELEAVLLQVPTSIH